ncbi:glycosyltransferase [Frankia sp. CcI6]|uniref:glycosyltransferase n=1 Tax=unclassified Frankia TaxID=2632575 RepID=UPI0003CFB6E0|nr:MULTISPECIES: glycosyltransferase [unclassified Frankia]ETA00710.1 glycosyltransferase [Frankia sp. CcI6]KFB04051.1 glycosyltransferase [Frankia sp. Allo2]OHV51559.1 glycosyl transferase family 1 [Frankia sp. CgIS1]
MRVVATDAWFHHRPSGWRRRGPITVLKVLNRMERSGIHPGAVNLLRRLDQDEFRLLFAVTSGAAGAFDGEIRALGGEVYHCRADWRFPWSFLRLLRQVRPDVVQAEVVQADVTILSGVVLALARLGGVRRRVAYLADAPDRHGDSLGGRVRRIVGRLLLDRFATHLVAVSEAVMRGLWRENWRLDSRCRVIYHGVELEPVGVAIAARRRAEELAEDDQDLVTIVHVACPDSAKSRDRAVEILAALRGRSVNARLLFVGRQDAAETARLVALASRRGVADHVEFIGEVLEIPRLLVAASLLLVTSRHEGLTGIVLEACAVGTPVLCADLPGVDEIARLLPGVTILPLRISDAVWADTAEMLTAVPPTIDQRREAMRLLRRSPFTMEHWQRDITAVWW